MNWRAHARRVRPNMPHYGVYPERKDALLDWSWAQSRLRAARNYWLCTTRPDGRPHATPIWAVWVNGDLIFGCDQHSRKARNIAANSHVALHLESGDETLIVEGAVEALKPSPALQAAINDAFAEKYAIDHSLDADELKQYRIVPRKIMAWLESDFPASVTYFLFD